MKYKEHQLKAVNFALPKRESLFSIKTGEGKTLIAITLAHLKLQKKIVDKVLYIATPSAEISILEEYKLYEKEPPLVLNSVRGLGKFIDSSQNLAMIRYSYFKRDFVKEYREFNVVMQKYSKLKLAMFLDECHCLLNPDSILTKAFRYARPFVDSVYGFTGTPISKDLKDLYQILEFIKPSHLGSYYEFCNNYVIFEDRRIKRNRYIKQVAGYKNLEHLQPKVDQVMFTYFPKSNLKFYLKNIELEDEAFQVYKVAARGLFETTEEKPFHSRMFDLQEVVNNSVVKKRLIKSIISPDGSIVYCEYYKSIDLLKSILGNYEIVEINGRMPTKQRKKNKDYFNSNPRGKILLVTKAASESLNLQSVDNIILYDVPYSLKTFSQLIGRIDRMNTKFNSLRVVIPMVKDTIDTYKYAYIKQNAAILRKLMNNESIPSVPSFSRYAIERAKKEYLWNKKR